MIPQCLAIINGKGGTLKTTLAANLAGILAAAGQRILLVDWDSQGDLGHDLGYIDTDLDDLGAAFAASLRTGAPLVVARGVRPGLDVVVGGEALDTIEPAAAARLQAVVATIADDYDLVIIDCPPKNPTMQLAALEAAHYVTIPTRADEASLRGLRKVAQLFAQLRAGANPGLELLGVVLTDVGSQSRQEQRRFRERCAELFGSEEAAFLASIRHLEVGPNDARRHGRLVHELDRAFYGRLGQRFPESIPGLQGDHQRLAGEMVGRISARVAA